MHIAKIKSDYFLNKGGYTIKKASKIKKEEVLGYLDQGLRCIYWGRGGKVDITENVKNLLRKEKGE